MSTHPSALSRRAIAMLKAVGEGRAELRCSCEPDLRVDGLSCCDQNAAHDLARAGLIRAAVLAAPGQWTAGRTDRRRAPRTGRGPRRRLNLFSSREWHIEGLEVSRCAIHGFGHSRGPGSAGSSAAPGTKFRCLG